MGLLSPAYHFAPPERARRERSELHGFRRAASRLDSEGRGVEELLLGPWKKLLRCLRNVVGQRKCPDY
jgi:hypothetical protein